MLKHIPSFCLQNHPRVTHTEKHAWNSSFFSINMNRKIVGYGVKKRVSFLCTSKRRQMWSFEKVVSLYPVTYNWGIFFNSTKRRNILCIFSLAYNGAIFFPCMFIKIRIRNIFIPRKMNISIYPAWHKSQGEVYWCLIMLNGWIFWQRLGWKLNKNFIAFYGLCVQYWKFKIIFLEINQIQCLRFVLQNSL